MSLSTGREDLEIAIIGMSCRFPGAPGIEAFWRNLRAGEESVSFFGEEELAEAGVSPAVLRDPDYVRAAALLPDIELFDARFFGFTAREAQVLDPQQRLFLEVAWEALERAGHDPGRFPGSIGVFGGASASSYALGFMANPEIGATVPPYQLLLSNDKDFLAARVAYKLDLRGPAVVVQTACSTSLVAVHVACQSLLAGECDMALAGGVSVSVPQKAGYRYEPDGILSRDGHCRAFDAAASGTLKGSGVGIVVLRRLSDARRDGDAIEAVIRGSATNNDGSRRVGFTAPGLDGQAEVVRAALAVAGVAADEITYVEAHGTATALGDPVEVAALTEVFRAGTARRGFCGIGSVKTNLGHLDAAAGVAGLIKTALMLKHRERVASLHFRTPNPRIDFEDGPFRVVTRNEPWPAEGPRRAGVSSFGMGGSNAHVVLEEPPSEAPRAADGADVLVVSAATEAALERATDDLAAHLGRSPGLALGDVAFTLRAGRRAFPHRWAVACHDVSEGARLLAARDPLRVFHAVAEESRPVAFLLSGQGAQHVDMARGLYRTEPVFTAEVDACCEALRPRLGLDLCELMFPLEGRAAEAGEQLSETRFTQPALFTIEHSLARLWMDWGVSPAALLGHSVGELVAACLAGVLSRDEALAVVAERGRCMQDCPRGAMTAVALPEPEVRALLPPSLDLCVVNGPDACVVGGPREDVERLEAALGERGIAHGRVATSHAFHSRLMEPALAPFAACLAGVRLQPPRLPFVSNVTGTWITTGQATDPAYWVRQLRETVRFAEGLATLAADPRRALLEVGPGHTLVALARRQRPGVLAVASLPHPRQPEAAEVFVLQTAARLWTHGVPVDLAARDRRSARRRVLLPTYPFERARYWLDGGPPADSAAASPARGGHTSRKLAVDRWLYCPSWRRTEPVTAGEGAASGGWCVLAPRGEGLGRELISALRAAGAAVTVVRPGAGFAREGPGTFTIDPERPEDYERLLSVLEAGGGGPDRFVHLWSMGAGAADPLASGFDSVVVLGRTLGGRRAGETSLDVVTWRAQDVLGAEPLSPLAATVLGPCRVIPQEYPLVRCRAIDVEDPADPANARWLARTLLAELASRSGARTVAYRGRTRWVQTFDPVDAAPGAAPLRPRGVYLVTGGLGKVGLALASYLARTVQARLVLTGRSALPERAERDRRGSGPGAGDDGRIRAVRALEAAGAEVLSLRADAADLDEMRQALGAARARFGRIDGVVHAAADLGPGTFRPLAATGRIDCERQLRPKLGGAEVLQRLLADDPPDFVLLTSSLSTVLGGLGLAAYAAANHALDAFARRQPAGPGRGWVSVCWDGWDFEDRPPESAVRLAATSISAPEGGEAFARALGRTGSSQIVVSTTPLGPRLEEWTGTGVRSVGPGEAALPGAVRDPRPEIGIVYVAPEDPVDRRLAVIWAEMLGIDRVGADDSFFELGGSSLVAVHMMGRVRKEYPVELSVTTLFEAPTVRALGRVIRSRRAEPPGPPPGVRAPVAALPTEDRRTLDAAGS